MSYQKLVKKSAKAPNVSFVVILPLFNNFWSHVQWSASISILELVRRLELLGQTHVSNFESVLPDVSRLEKAFFLMNQNVFDFDVSVDDVLLTEEIL